MFQIMEKFKLVNEVGASNFQSRKEKRKHEILSWVDLGVGLVVAIAHHRRSIDLISSLNPEPALRVA